MLEQLSGEHLLKGYKNSRIAYEVMNKRPRTLTHALNEVTLMEHNFRVKTGWDDERRDKAK